MKKIILASQSPRRKELLAKAGYDFEVITSDVEEVITKNKPEEIAEDLSCQKAEDVFNKVVEKYGKDDVQDCVVIGADTIVSIDGEILGKPVDEEDAYRMISMLQGRTHQVYTGVTLVYIASDSRKVVSFNECTDVTFYPMTEEEIESYVNKETIVADSSSSSQLIFDWSDKAGAYGIQSTSAKYIKGINGDYYNVVGLPIARLHQELKKIV